MSRLRVLWREETDPTAEWVESDPPEFDNLTSAVEWCFADSDHETFNAPDWFRFQELVSASTPVQFTGTHATGVECQYRVEEVTR